MKRVTMVLRTPGLEYDDRVRKECESLTRAGADVTVAHIAETNVESRETMWESTRAISFRLRTRTWFRRSEGLGFKVVEFAARSAFELMRQRPDVAWLHNKEIGILLPFAFLLRRLGWIGAVVWDQHELPPERLWRNPLTRWALRWAMSGCDVVVVANAPRRDHLYEQLGREISTPLLVVENWPDREFARLAGDPLPAGIRDWVGKRRYLLAQGGAHPGRHFENLVAALMDTADLAMIVAGGARPELRRQLEERWGQRLAERILFTGWIPQMELYPLIDHAAASVVLYDDGAANTRLCAPNRLYQALARGTPVLAGSNPPLAKVVEGTGVGVVLEGSGEDPEDIRAGIQALLGGLSEYAVRARENRLKYLWEHQEGTVLAAASAEADTAASGEPETKR